MNLAERRTRTLRAARPSPFAIAVVLTEVTFLLAFFSTGEKHHLPAISAR